MIRQILLVFLLIQMASGTVSTVAAEPAGTAFATGKHYYDQGRFDEAYKEFRKAFVEDPANLDLNFHLGRAAFESGRLEESVMAYDRILIANPGATRVKLELARAHLRLGSRELAKQYFREVLASNPPPQVWRNIQKFLDAIAASEQHHFLNGIFTFGLSHDDNVNVAPADSSIDINLGGVTIPIDIKQKPTSDEIYNTTLVANHIYKFEESPNTWKTSVVNYNAFYASQSVHDLNYVSLASGPALHGRNYLWQTQGLVGYVDLEHDRYQSLWGLNSALTWLMDRNLVFNLGVTGQQKNNYRDDERDAYNYLLSAGPIISSGLNRISLSVGAEYENAARDFNSYDRFTAMARYDRQLPHDFVFYAGYRFQNTRYRQPRPSDTLINSENRSDNVRDLSCGLTTRLWQSRDSRRTLSGQINYSNTKAKSSIGLYEYDKNVTTAALSVSF
jgi:tetratricopeptide (TPR) repeat protein